MRKLNKRGVCWIIKQMKKGELSVYRIAKQRDISSRWVRYIWRKYQETGGIVVPQKCGKKPIPITKKEKKLILKTWKENPLGAVNLGLLLQIREGIHIPHNKIHKVIKENGIAEDQPSKQERRKWVRYERKHSNSMWHVDWSSLPDGRKIIIYEDDASRFITGYGVFDEATLENSLKVFKKAVKKHGAPKQLLSDNGTQFRFSEAFDRDMDTKNKFQKIMERYNVEQIFTRVHRPQANGKVERLFYSIKKYAKHFGTVRKAVEYYNFRRPHMSLNMKVLETPSQAFKRKMKKKRK